MMTSPTEIVDLQRSKCSLKQTPIGRAQSVTDEQMKDLTPKPGPRNPENFLFFF